MSTSSVPSAPRQVIRRPPKSRPGGPAPWAQLPVAARRGLTVDRVVEALSDSGLLRVSSEWGGTKEPWRALLDEGEELRHAAVLVALFEEGAAARVVLTVRSERLTTHRGEAAFPGGRLDPGEDAVHGALREAEEEVALDPATVTVVATLTPMPTVASNNVMTPVVATLPARPRLVASPDEVVRVFDVSLDELVGDGAFHEELWAVPGRPGANGVPGDEFPVWFFDVGGEIVWGATARTLVELLCLVLDVEPPASLLRLRRGESPTVA
jgi:8-oxo-dGTP pyrophosphatase MutT (NUDIX family)